jgi:thiamine-phosphate diphosphorylase
VHLGPDDVPVSVARGLFTQGEVIGASVGSIEEAASGKEADYWGVGPLNGSATKLDAGKSLGIAGFRQIVAQAGGRPCIAIGGVRPEDVRPVLEAGGAGVAVVSGILGSADVEVAARRYGEKLMGVRSEE